MTLDDLQRLGFDLAARNHSLAILQRDFPAELQSLCDVLGGFTIGAEELIHGGGGEAPFTQRLRRELEGIGWPKRSVRIRKLINGDEKDSETHEIDHFREGANGGLALEIEWNNKDPFFNRDLETFHQLHAEGVVSVGTIVTRGSNLQRDLEQIVLNQATARGCQTYDGLIAEFGLSPSTKQLQEFTVHSQLQEPSDFLKTWAHKFVQSKFGAATTHWAKLMERIDRGVGNPCPLLLLGLPSSLVQIS